jgi:hypothetical protein
MYLRFMDVTTVFAFIVSAFYNYLCLKKKNDSQRGFFFVVVSVIEEELFPRKLGPDISLFRDMK